MKPYFFSFLAFCLLWSCTPEKPKETPGYTAVSAQIQYKEQDGYFWLTSGRHQYRFAQNQLPLRKIVLLNASLLGYITALGAEDRMVGISSPEYVFSEKVKQNLQQQKTQNIGNEQKYDVEQIIALKPDAVFTNYVGSFGNTYAALKKAGIEVVFIDEYSEEKPLQKAAIIKVFGKLLGLEQKAERVFTAIKEQYRRYQSMAAKSPRKPKVLANEMYGNQWFVAGGRSQLAHFIKDAHAQYVFGDNEEVKSVPRSFEEVFAVAQNAEYWVNVGNHKERKELLVQQPAYSKMQVFQKGNIYSLTGREKGQSNDYFESGVVRADLVLKDYIKIFHPELFAADSLTYMRKLK